MPYLYNEDVVSEDAIMRWAEEKEHADESDKVFVKQSEAFIQVYIYVLHLCWFTHGKHMVSQNQLNLRYSLIVPFDQCLSYLSLVAQPQS